MENLEHERTAGMLIEGVSPIQPVAGSSTLSEYLRAVCDENRQSSTAERDPRPTATERAERIAAIKKKIRKGYYNTETVLEDLSSSFAGVFDKLT